MADLREPDSTPGAALFPLPLSDFEAYLLADDRPSHPMIFTLSADLMGVLNRVEFTAAVVAALECHPLLKCRIRPVSGRGLCWVPEPAAQPRIAWKTASDDDSLMLAYIDLRGETGLQIDVTATSHGERVVFFIHHCCCDGVGAMEFLGEVFARYGLALRQPGEAAPAVGATRLSDLRQRSTFSPAPRSLLRSFAALWNNGGHAWRMLFRRPLLIAAKSPLEPVEMSSRAGSRTLTESLAAEVTERLREVARSLNASLNDVCILELLRLIREWTPPASTSAAHQGMRLLIPLNLRSMMHDHMPAANLVSYSFVTRKFADCANPQALLQSICRQTAGMLQPAEQHRFLNCLRYVRRVPGLLSLLLRIKPCFGTIVLANVGDVRRLFSGRFPRRAGKWIAGNVVIERIGGVAPIRPQTRAAMSIGIYAGELIVNLRTDATVLSQSDSQEFLARFLSRLEGIAQSGGLAGPLVLDDSPAPSSGTAHV